MEDSDSSDEDDFDEDHYDEFFFDSIQKYNTLQMFTLENVPYHILQLSNTTICIASKLSKKEQSEVLKLLLPPKLTLPRREESRSKGNDFKVLCGLYTKNLVQKAVKLTDQEIITSENNISGLVIYTFVDGTLETQNQGTVLDVNSWVSPNFTLLNERNKVIVSKCAHDPLLQLDINDSKSLKIIQHPFQEQNVLHDEKNLKGNSSCSNRIKCEVLDENLIIILNTKTGESVLHDLRTSNFIDIPKLLEKQNDEIWTLSSFDLNPSTVNHFGILSNKKSFCIYDKRTNSAITQRTGFCIPITNIESLKLKFCERGDKFSISGVDSSVEIFKLNRTDFDHVFTHNGHTGGATSSAKYIVTDHIWLQAGGNEYVASICENKTLNCWDYKV